MKKILLCPPTHYDIEYEINPWMHAENQVNKQKVQEEYQSLKKAYEELGCEILEINQEKGLPDMVYVANCGFAQGKTFIKSNYTFDVRKKEAELAENYFKKLGFTLKELPKDITWEGQGDLLTVAGKYFLGYGKRSDQKAKQYLSECLQAEIIDLHLVDPYYYHLDTCFLPLDQNTAMINPDSFEKEDRDKIAQHFSRIITVGKKDNAILACNGVVVDKTVVLGKGISQELINDLKTAGYEPYEVEMAEYRKGGGSVKCLTLEFY